MKNIKEAFPEFSKPSIAIDTVVLRVKNIEDKTNRTISRMQMQVLLVKKSGENQWHLPGTILRLGETSIDAINRIVSSKVDISNIHFEQLYTIMDDLDRDDRGHVISVVYIGMMNEETIDIKDYISNGYEAQWFWVGREYNENKCKRILMNEKSCDKIEELMYDHDKIISDTINRIKGKLMYSDIGFKFIGNKFTIKELENVFNAINERDIPGFRRYIANKIEGTGVMSEGNAFRPAELFIKKQ